MKYYTIDMNEINEMIKGILEVEPISYLLAGQVGQYEYECPFCYSFSRQRDMSKFKHKDNCAYKIAIGLNDDEED